MSYKANEPLIAPLPVMQVQKKMQKKKEERPPTKTSCLPKFSLLLGLLLGFLVQVMIIETKVLVITFWDGNIMYHQVPDKCCRFSVFSGASSLQPR
jgi:hypothetical protein